MIAVTEFADWVLGIVAVLFVGGVVASVKAAVDVAVIKSMLKHGDTTFARIDVDIGDIRQAVKRHSERIRDLEVPPSNGTVKSHGRR